MALHCLIAGCEKNTYGTRLCAMHRKRIKLYGNAHHVCRTENGLPAKFIDAAIKSATDDCILWPFSVSKTTGYADINLKTGTGRVHRIVCERTKGPAPTKKHEAAHSCNVRRCINPRHLRWATRIENQWDRLAHGTHNRGERQGAHKLTEQQAKEIIAMGWGDSKAVAAKYGVNDRHIRSIWQGQSWAWLRSTPQT